MKRILILIWSLIATSGIAAAQEKPELSLQRGHSGQAEILATAVSSDLRAAYTVGTDGSIKVWNTDTGQVMRTIYDAKSYPDEEDLGTIVSSVFSPTSDWVATIDEKGVVRRFTLPDGKLVDSFGPEGTETQSLLLTDGRWLYLFAPKLLQKRALDGTLELSREIPEIPRMKQQYVSLSADGRLLSVGHSRAVSLIRTSDLETVSSRETENPIRSVSVAPQSDRLVFTTDQEAILLEGPDWTEKGRIEFEYSGMTRAAFWYQDQPHIYAYETSAYELLARIDFAASRLERIEGKDSCALTVSVTPDSKFFFGRFGGTAWIYDPSTKERQTFESDIGGFSSFDLHSTTGDLFTGSRDGKVVRWSRETGRIEQNYEGLKESWVSSVDISPDGTRVLGADYSWGQVVCWDIETGKPISSINLGRGRFAHGVTWTKWIDNDHYAYSAYRAPLTVINARTGAETISWEVEKQSPRCLDTKDGRLVAGYSNNQLLETGANSKRDTLVKQLPYARSAAIVAVTYGATNQTVFCVDSKGHLFRWDVGEPDSKPEEIGSVEGQALEIDYREGHLQVWLAGGELVTLSSEGKLLSSLKLVDGNAWGDHIISDNTILAITDYYKLGFYDALDGHRKGRLISVRDNAGWVALEASGSFDGNDIGLSTIQFALDGELYGVDQFMTQYLRPGILAELLPGAKKSLRTAAPLTSSTVKKPPTVRILEPASGSKIAGDKVNLHIEVVARGAGASAPLVYHNGHRLPEAKLQKLGEDRFQYEVKLVQGLNELQATAFDSSNQVESRRDRIRVSAPDVQDRPPKLHLLSVGIDSYGSGLKLEFAGEDAQSISELFQSDLYSTGTRTLLKNNEATQEGIKKAIAQLAAVAEPQDAFVLYLAGHGTVVNDTYYFLPQDVKTSSDQELERTALSADLLGTMLASVSATKQLLVLDTCRAGKLVEDGKIYSRPGLEEVRSHNLLSRTSGTFLIAATKEKDYAFEIPQLGHGILTYSVLETLGVKEGKAESAVTANELLRAVSQKVPELSQKYNGTRQMVVQYSSGQDFPLTK